VALCLSQCPGASGDHQRRHVHACWYDIKGLDRKAAEDVAGFRDADAQIRRLIARESSVEFRESHCPRRFSQGAAVSLYTAVRLPEGLAGVMHCPVISRERAASVRARTRKQLHPDIHGSRPRGYRTPSSYGVQARNFLKAQGYLVEWHEYPMGHAVCAAEVTDIREFLFRVLS